MNERVEKIKTHFKEHKETYLVGTLCVSFATITSLIMRSNTTSKNDNAHLLGAFADDNAHLLGASVFSFSDSDITDSFNTVVNVLEREGRGHPGYMVKCIEDNITYSSQLKAATAYDIHPNRMSDHLNGRLEHLDGKHFERIVLAA